MTNGRTFDVVSAAQRDFVVEVADSDEAIYEAQELRYQVFCTERSVFPISSKNNLEIDDFDANARHILIRNRTTSEVVGTVRLVLSSPSTPGYSFPMQRYCDPDVFLNLPMKSTAEISRFALSKQRRAINCPSDSLLRLGLMQGILRISSELRLTHWCAVMERSLLRLLQGAGVHFAAVGPMIEMYGLRQPSIAEIGTVLTRGKRQCPDLYAFITDGVAQSHDDTRDLMVAQAA